MMNEFQRYRLKSPFLLARQIVVGEAEIVFNDGGMERADAGDWVVMDAWGKKHVCKSDVFERIYEQDTGISGVLAD